MVKFITNNNKSVSTKLFPFFIFKNLYLYMSFDIVNFSNANTCERINKQKTLDISRNI